LLKGRGVASPSKQNALADLCRIVRADLMEIGPSLPEGMTEGYVEATFEAQEELVYFVHYNNDEFVLETFGGDEPLFTANERMDTARNGPAMAVGSGDHVVRFYAASADWEKRLQLFLEEMGLTNPKIMELSQSSCLAHSLLNECEFRNNIEIEKAEGMRNNSNNPK
jgi:hypothetical protein